MSASAVLAEVRREREGLSRRLEDARERAAGLVGVDTLEYLNRDAEAEAELVVAETQMRQASYRLGRLDQHISDLVTIADAIRKLKSPA